MRRHPAASAILLAAWLLPLAAQVGVMIHLLDAARTAHPSSFVELLVHGHPHAGRVPDHEHAIREGPASRVRVHPPATLGGAVPASGALALPAAPAPPPAAASHGCASHLGSTRESAPLRFLLLCVFLR